MYARSFSSLSALVFLIFVSAAQSQVATGTYPFGTFDNKGFETINVGSLNMHFAIPVLNKTGRGKLAFSYNMGYDSSVWMPVTTNGVAAWQPVTNWGWQVATDAATGYMTYTTTTSACSGGTVSTISNVAYHDEQGTSHPFAGSEWTQSAACGSPTSGGTIGPFASDGSGYEYLGPGSITALNGTTWTVPVNTESGPATVTDSNGNQITVDGSGHFTDTTGNVVLTVAGGGTGPQTFVYKDTSGNSQTVTVTYGTYTVKTAFDCSGVGEYGPVSTSLVSSITFPDGSAYQFTYEATPGASGDVTGRVATIELPQGGTIHYSYSGGNNGIVCADGSTAGLTRTQDSNAGSPSSTWTYARTSPNGTGTSHTEVVDGASNHLAYDFVEASNQSGGTTAAYYETNRSVYQGAETGTAVLARQTCYDLDPSPCTANRFGLPISEVDTYETLDGIEMHGTSTVVYNTGLPANIYTYDFGGSSSRGSLLEREAMNYTTQNQLINDGFYDGSNNEVAGTTYAYDGSTATASSGVPQHVAATGTRGNLTSIIQYANASTSYTSTITYEDTGTPLTYTAPTGTTTLSYDSTFVYNTAVALPTPSSGVALGSGSSYDTANTGLPLTFTDANGQVIRVSSYDAMLRATEVDSPDGGKTTTTYSPTLVTTNTYQTSSTYSEAESQYDSYGRPSRTAVSNGGNWYQQDTCYDSNGNVGFTSYRYQGTGLGSSKICSGAGDTFTHDVLGRLTSVTHADGTSLTYTYKGRATQSTDENGVSRISQLDGLGRTTIVCEISSNGNMPASGSPTNCGTDISGTGFTTTYSYSLVNHETTVTQGAQTRTFQTDWLGRTISVMEPESGTTNYTYSYSNSTGLQIMRTRPKANQTSSSVFTTTYISFDKLNRILSVVYTDGTPIKSFMYDKSDPRFSDLSQTNLKGRLSSASTSVQSGQGYTTPAGTAYSYDPVGRVSYLDECVPSGCGTVAYNRQLHYTYDLAGNMLTSTDGGGVQSTYSISTANEILSLTSSLNNSTNPTSILTNIQNGPYGPASYGLGNGLNGVYSYDSLGRVNGGWLCSGSTTAGCTGGTQVYGFLAGWKGVQLTGSSDSVLNQQSSYGYDEFNRLASRTVTSGTVANYTYVYDRYGNRWQQNVSAGSGPQPQLSFNTANNQVDSGGFSYDAAGNMTNDGTHAYTYDAEGNITAVDGGSTATYTYDALNDRVRAVVGSTATEFIFNQDGRRASVWNGTTRVQLRGQYYWGGKPVAFYTTASAGAAAAHFQHQDWQGTERMRTAYNATVEGSFTSLPFGDSQATSGADQDQYHYATLDHDTETDTDHADARQYSDTQGRWLSPDSYAGSYDTANPQSFNRYTYVLNNPLSSIDPTGQDCTNIDNEVGCTPTAGTGDDGSYSSVTSDPAGTVYYDPDDGNFYILNANGTLSPWVPWSASVDSCQAQDGCYTSMPVGLIGTPPSQIPSQNIPSAPTSTTPGTQVSAACQAKLLSMLNAEHGTSLTASNITGTYLNGTAGNLLISASGLTPAQFNSFQPGRYTSYGGQSLLGFGMAGHIANEPGVNPGAVFSSSNIGGNLSVSFAFHDDHGYANNPIGALIHFFTDVLGHNSRKQC